MISTTMITAGLRIRIILIRIQIQIALFFTAEQDPDTNFHFDADPDPAPISKLCESATTGLQTLHGAILSLLSVHCPPKLRF